jgi:hypothetical protein
MIETQAHRSFHLPIASPPIRVRHARPTRDDRHPSFPTHAAVLFSMDGELPPDGTNGGPFAMEDESTEVVASGALAFAALGALAAAAPGALAAAPGAVADALPQPAVEASAMEDEAAAPGALALGAPAALAAAASGGLAATP